MANDVIDLTIPAHDPSFPKPRGLLARPARGGGERRQDGCADPPGARHR